MNPVLKHNIRAQQTQRNRKFTLKALSKIVADYILFFYYFSEKIRLGISLKNEPKKKKKKIKILSAAIVISALSLFVCVEVLQPSQPNGVMSRAVSLPNHTFTGQA